MSVIQRIKDYRSIDAVNQSLIKEIITGKKWNDEEICYSSALSCGNLLDLYITIPKEEWESMLYINDSISVPGDKAYKAIHSIKDFRLSDVLRDNMSLLESLDYYSNWTLEKRMDTLIKEGENYWNHLLVSEGKWIIDKTDYIKVDNAFSNYTTYIEPLLKEMGELKYQQEVYFNYLNTPCKQLLDIVILQDEKPVAIVDVKYTDSINNWKYVAKTLRYDIQAGFANIYAPVPFYFAFCSENGCKLIKVTEEDIKVARYGLTMNYPVLYTSTKESDIFTKEILGIDQAIDIIKGNQIENLNLFSYDVRKSI